MKNWLRRFWRDEQGLELSEYAIMCALIIVVALVVITALGEKITTVFETVGGKLDEANTAGT